MNIFIRTDASRLIGSGHVMRCLTLADMLKKEQHTVQFVCRDLPGNIINMIEQQGYCCHVLPFTSEQKKHYSSMKVSDDYHAWRGVDIDIDIKQTQEVLKDCKCDLLVVDHYGIDQQWEKALRPCVDRIMVIDDLANRQHDCDIILDHNYYLEYQSRYDHLVPTHCKKLLGPQNALISPRLRKVKHERESLGKSNKIDKVSNILVFLGGMDPKNYTGSAIEAIIASNQFEHSVIHVVLGRHNPNKAALKKQYAEYDNIVFHVQPPYYHELLVNADLAVGAGGVAQLERGYINLPTLLICIADNQNKIVKDAVQSGFAKEIKALSLLNSDEGLFDFKDVQISLFDPAEIIEQSTTKQFISIVTDRNSWINEYVPDFCQFLKKQGYIVESQYRHQDLQYHGVVCYLSYSKIVSKSDLMLNRHNLIVHESDLPKGKGWSPLTWQIIEGKNQIPVTLIEANENIDSGQIYLKKYINLRSDELVDELRQLQAEASFDLIYKFLQNYRSVVNNAVEQYGIESFYPKRTPIDSKLDTDKTIRQQFNLLRVVDNERYPAFFELHGNLYILKIYKSSNR